MKKIGSTDTIEHQAINIKLLTFPRAEDETKQLSKDDVDAGKHHESSVSSCLLSR